MNILFVLSSFAIIGGLERVMSDKINYLAEQGHHVVLATYEQGIHPHAYPLSPSVKHVDLNCRYFLLYKYPKLIRSWKGFWMKKTFLEKLQKLVEKERIDVLVAPTNVSVFMEEIMKIRGASLVVESHAAFTKTMSNEHLIANYHLKRQLTAIKNCDLLIALTHQDENHWRKHVKEVMAIPNPVTFYVEEPDASLHQAGRILAAGRLKKQKRFDRLIEAFAMIADKYPEWYIDIFGEDSEQEKPQLDKLIKKKGLTDRVIFHREIADMVSEYLHSQFFVLSSDYEGFGLVLVEAMACGLPVVSTDCPFGPSDIIEDGVTGLLSKMDVHDLAEKMEWMITHDAERKEMGVKAHQAVARYKKEIVMKEWEQAYLSVIK